MEEIRALFEEKFPVPLGVEWREGGSGFIPQYVITDHYMPNVFDNCNSHNSKWVGWKAAFKTLENA